MMTALQYQALRRIRPSGTSHLTGDVYKKNGKLTKLDILVGDLLDDVQGKKVIDFGCGDGHEAVEIAQRGASHVLGVDLSQECLARAWRNAELAGVQDRIAFATAVADESADVVVSLDSFEHFADPQAILDQMNRLLVPGGAVVISFGPPWYHPYGGHLFSVFPWAHLVFSERALVQWRSDHRHDGKNSFAEAGLNRMTIRRFVRLVNRSQFRIEYLELVPIRHTKPLHNRLTRECFTSVVRCKLSKNRSAGAKLSAGDVRLNGR